MSLFPTFIKCHDCSVTKSSKVKPSLGFLSEDCLSFRFSKALKGNEGRGGRFGSEKRQTLTTDRLIYGLGD